MSFFLSLFRHADESKLKADTGNGHGPSKGTRLKKVGRRKKSNKPHISNPWPTFSLSCGSLYPSSNLSCPFSDTTVQDASSKIKHGAVHE